MKTKMMTKMMIKISACVLLALLWVSIPAFADPDEDCTGNPHHCNGGGNGNGNGDDHSQSQEQAASATSDAMSASDSSSVNEGNNTEINSRTENNSSNIVLVPNNNTENCLRVIGIAFGKNGESAAFGWPFRSKKCDYEGAADDAFAQGEHELGWFWKCENPNLYKSFKDKGESNRRASDDCLTRMVGGMRATQTITTMTKTIETMEQAARSRDTLHKQREEEWAAACNEEKNRMLRACMNTK